MAGEIHHDEARRRFTLDRDGRVSHLLYTAVDSETVDFTSTWVHPELRGRGIGARLVAHALAWAESRKLRVIPTCWYVAEYVDRNPRFDPLIVRR
jgi:predicted GNAT family acetyltransferase